MASGVGVLVAEEAVGVEGVSALAKFLQECPPPEPHPRCLTASYWIDAQAALDKPANVVEALVGCLLRRPDVAAKLPLAAIAGAEWWWQDVDSEDPPKVYHVDQNVWQLDDGTLARCVPLWGSVLYLGDEGGPTVVFGDDCVAAVMPRCGRYMLFQGDRTHGVLHAPTEGSYDRLTLLVNFWTSRPPGLSDGPGSLSEKKLEGTPADAECRLAFDRESAELLSSLQQMDGADVRLLQAPAPMELGLSFADHATAWTNQQLPESLRPMALGSTRCVAVRYSDKVALQ